MYIQNLDREGMGNKDNELQDPTVRYLIKRKNEECHPILVPHKCHRGYLVLPRVYWDRERLPGGFLHSGGQIELRRYAPCLAADIAARSGDGDGRMKNARRGSLVPVGGLLYLRRPSSPPS